MRYLITADGSTIQETRKLHNTILDYQDPFKSGKAKDGDKPEMSVHNHILDDVPVDTDGLLCDDKKAGADRHLGIYLHGLSRRNHQIPRRERQAVWEEEKEISSDRTTVRHTVGTSESPPDQAAHVFSTDRLPEAVAFFDFREGRDF